MQYIAKNSNAVVIGISETKLDNTVYESEVPEQIITEFETLDLNDEHYVHGDFNINFLFMGKYIFDKPNEFRQLYKDLSLNIKKYTEFCSTYSFKQMIKSPTTTTCSMSTLTNHILTNTQEYISQSGIIDTTVSDHSKVCCTRKISRAKYNKHKEITFRSLKNYSDDVY